MEETPRIRFTTDQQRELTALSADVTRAYQGGQLTLRELHRLRLLLSGMRVNTMSVVTQVPQIYLPLAITKTVCNQTLCKMGKGKKKLDNFFDTLSRL